MHRHLLVYRKLLVPSTKEDGTHAAIHFLDHKGPIYCTHKAEIAYTERITYVS